MVYKTTIKTLLIALLMGLSTTVKGQGGVTQFLELGQENATTFAGLYLAPLGNSLGANLNSGWYNTGQAHRLGRFDFRISLPVTFVGKQERFFTVSPDDFNNIALVDPANNDSPTVFGDNTPGPVVSFFNRPETIALPQGTGVNVFPIVPPTLQLNLGFIKDTEFMVRYVPEIEIEGFSTQMIGFGIKHGVKQYIPGLKHLPFDLSVIAAWSRFNASYGLNSNADLQKLDISSTAMNFNLIASKKFSVITLYGGVRYMTSDTGFSLLGDFPVAPANGVGADVILTDPISLDMSHSQFGLNGGFRLKIGFISFFVDGTLANYSTVSGGMSLGFHN